jgi:hypothetical protein
MQNYVFSEFIFQNLCRASVAIEKHHVQGSFVVRRLTKYTDRMCHIDLQGLFSQSWSVASDSQF